MSKCKIAFYTSILKLNEYVVQQYRYEVEYKWLNDLIGMVTRGQNPIDLHTTVRL